MATPQNNPFCKLKLVEYDLVGKISSADITEEFAFYSDEESDVDDIEII